MYNCMEFDANRRIIPIYAIRMQFASNYAIIRFSNNLRGDKSLIIAMKSMNAADITTQHDNLFKVWFCVFPKSIFTLRSSVKMRN